MNRKDRAAVVEDGDRFEAVSVDEVPAEARGHGVGQQARGHQQSHSAAGAQERHRAFHEQLILIQMAAFGRVIEPDTRAKHASAT